MAVLGGQCTPREYRNSAPLPTCLAQYTPSTWLLSEFSEPLSLINLIEPEEGVVGNSNLQPVGQKHK